MRKLVALTVGIFLATLTLSGIGKAQAPATIHGTIQAVDCKTNVLLVKADDGTQYNIRVSPGSGSAVFVNSTPVSFCTLQQYIGSSVTVSLVSNGDQLIVKRVDVNNAATTPAAGPSTISGPPLITGMPKWAEIALGVIIVGALVYIGTQRHDPPTQNQPYYQCRDGSWRQSCP